MDIKHSLTYFRKQEGWIKIYALILLLMLLFLIPIIGMIAYFILTGFVLVLTNHRIFKPEIPIAQWDTVKNFKAGVKLYIFGLIFLPINLPLLQQSQNPVMLITMLSISFVVALPIIDIAAMAFSTNLKFSSLFKLKAMKFILIDNFSQYIKVYIIKFIVCLVIFAIPVLVSTFTTGLFLAVPGLALALILISVVAALLLLPSILFVYADLNAQFLRKIFKIKTSQG